MSGAQTPIQDLLRGVPSDARCVYNHSPTFSQNIPVGNLAAQALAKITALENELCQSRQPSAQGGERVEGPTRCANCGKPYVVGEAFITEGDPEGEYFCSTECFDQHGDLGCPHEHHSGYRHPAEAKRLIDCENALRSLASWLGVGGYNAPEVDAEIFEKKIRDGVSYLVPALATPPATSGMKEAEPTVRMFPILGKGKSIPWSVVAPYEKRAQLNHGQTLDRLAQRGGLAPEELLALLRDVHWSSVVELDLSASRKLDELVKERLATGAAEGAEPTADAETKRLRQALVYVAHMMHKTPRHMLPEGVMLMDGDGVVVALNGWHVSVTERGVRFLPDRIRGSMANPDTGAARAAQKGQP